MHAVTKIETEFAAAMAAHGLQPAEIVGDGRIHRFKGPEDRGGKQSAWYVLYADGIGGGAFGDFKTQIHGSWRGEAAANWTPAEREAHRARVDERRKLEEASASLCTPKPPTPRACSGSARGQRPSITRTACARA